MLNCLLCVALRRRCLLFVVDWCLLRVVAACGCCCGVMFLLFTVAVCRPCRLSVAVVRCVLFGV